MRSSVARRSRSTISCSTRRSRNCSKVAPSRAHCSDSFGNSRQTVGSRSYPFGGSGTTVIACEKTGRRARVIDRGRLTGKNHKSLLNVAYRHSKIARRYSASLASRPKRLRSAILGSTSASPDRPAPLPADAPGARTLPCAARAPRACNLHQCTARKRMLGFKWGPDALRRVAAFSAESRLPTNVIDDAQPRS
jgi:hypothetical protein